MSEHRQIWHLFKFHFLAVPPRYWGFLAAVSPAAIFFAYLPVVLSPEQADKHSSFLMTVCLAWLLFPFAWGEVCLGRGQVLVGPESRHMIGEGIAGHGDFLWTRAVDRALVFWSKLMALSVVALVLWAIALLPLAILWLANFPIPISQFLAEAGWSAVWLFTLGAVFARLGFFTWRDLPAMALIGGLLLVWWSISAMAPEAWRKPLFLPAAALLAIWSVRSAARRYAQGEGKGRLVKRIKPE